MTTTTEPISRGGAPIWLQKHKVRAARRRPRVVQTIRCKLGMHNPPYDQMFEEYASIMVGGKCTRCNDDVVREIVWIGDVWRFISDGATVQEAVSAHLNHLLGSR